MNRKLNPKRLIACNEVLTPDGRCLIQHVLEISEGYLADLYPLLQEQGRTEWLTGRVELRTCDDGRVCAYYKGRLLT